MESLLVKEITKNDLANRDVIRSISTRGRETVKIPFDKIKIRSAFNIRQDYGDIEGLANSILENGLLHPITVDVLKDGIAIPTDGHRRLRAIQLIRENGNDYQDVECIVNGKATTEDDRIFSMIVANDNEPLKPLEEADCYRRLLNLGYKPDGIAKRVGKSRAHIDNMLLLNSATQEEKELVKNKDIKPSAMITAIRNEPSIEKRKEVIKENGGKLKIKDAAKLSEKAKKIDKKKENAIQCLEYAMELLNEVSLEDQSDYTKLQQELNENLEVVKKFLTGK